MRLVATLLLPSLLIVPGAACAQTAVDTAPPKAFTLDGNVTLTSDYRFRGISQSNRDPAIQGSVNLVHRSGIYVGTFVSTIGDYVVDGADPEIDLYGGVRGTLGGIALDGGLLYYVYPGTVSFKGNYFEPYITASHTLGPVTAKLGGNFSWKQKGLGQVPGERLPGAYTYAELSAGIPTTPITLTGHLGHAYHANYGTFGTRYTDWSVAAGYQWKRLNLSLAYIDTDKNIRSYPTGGGHDHNVGGAGLAASAALSF